jgi:hypothetical protein
MSMPGLLSEKEPASPRLGRQGEEKRRDRGRIRGLREPHRGGGAIAQNHPALGGGLLIERGQEKRLDVLHDAFNSHEPSSLA